MSIDPALPEPPALAGHVWRPARRTDAPAIRQLYLACDAATGQHDARLVAGYEGDFDNADTTPDADTLVAADDTGKLAALAWLSVSRAIKHQYRAQLEGAVHPHFRGRGLGDFLLSWMEARARQILGQLPHDRERVLRIDFAGARAEAVSLYERHGFALNHSEYIMRRDLRQPIPGAPLPPGFAFVSYHPGLADSMHQIYADAFRERVGGATWTASAWSSAFLGYSGFRADCSFVVMDGDTAAAYVASGIDPIENEHQENTEGWILQIGVRPAYRRRGLASALLCEVMRRFRSEGLDFAALDVNVNNPSAKLAYERVGFFVHRQFTVYRKVVA